tara:strand:- start:1721 stop:2917 length:1197 start_codon:yes stop_codon:yes gene_type:complete
MKHLKNSDIKNKKTIVRLDLNVPFFESKITDYSRIYSILPTLEKLLKNKNKVFLITHFGRPKGKINKKYSTEFLCLELKKILNLNTIHFLDNCDQKIIKRKVSEMDFGEICLLENIRFNPEEETNDLNFSKLLASSFDIYINDAFSASHRNHASITGITNYLPSYAGLSFSKEIEILDKFLENSNKPNLAIIGGSKVSTKIKVLENLVEIFDVIIIGGAMANTFLLSNNFNVGSSLVENDFIDLSIKIQKKAESKNCKLVLPIDVVCSKNLEDRENVQNYLINNIPNDKTILDIGAQSTQLILDEISKSKSVLWNGPLGAFEYSPFDKSTISVAEIIKDHSSKYQLDALAGGGDTLAAIKKAKANEAFNHLSTAGGAFLEWLEGKKSPGYIALNQNSL